MPRESKQRNLNDFFANPPVKGTRPKKKTKKLKIENSPANAISLSSSESDWDGGGGKLVPSSQITSTTRVIESDSEGSDGPVEQSPLAKRRRLEAAALAVSGDDISSGSDDHVPLNLLAQRKRKLVIMDDSEEERQLTSPRKKRRTLVRGLRPTAEEENILDELDQDVLLEPRLRPVAKKSAFTKSLERRKRERLGLAKASTASSQDSESDTESTEHDESAKLKPIPGARKAGDQGAESLGQEDEDSESDSGDTDDFVVEDDEEDSAAAGLNLPTQFSRAQPLVLSFKVFFQFLVHVACQPPHLREPYVKARLSGSNPTADYFNNAINHLRRTLGSIRDSQVASTIWTSGFRKLLETLPELDVTIVEVEPYCHACRKHQALSTREARLSGQAYNSIGFEPLEDSPDEDSDDEDDSSESSEEPPLEIFKLGQHCARRVSLFHAFMHWEYHLFRAIEAEIVGFETLNRERLLKKKRRKYDTDDPDRILELLDEKKMVDQQWKQVQSLMERAKNIEMRRAGEID